MPKSLQEICDYLSPGLWAGGCGNANKRVDLSADYATDSIVIQIEGKEPQVLFTRKELDDRGYVAAFRPKILELLKE